jgi:hypothetical protein
MASQYRARQRVLMQAVELLRRRHAAGLDTRERLDDIADRLESLAGTIDRRCLARGRPHRRRSDVVWPRLPW